MTETVPLRRERRPLDAFSDTFSVLRALGRPLLSALLRFPLPLLIGVSIPLALVANEFQGRVGALDFGMDDMWLVAALVVLGFVALYASIWLSAMTLVALRRTADGQGIEGAPLRAEAGPYVWRLIGAGLLGGLCLLPLLVLIIIPCLGWIGMVILGGMGAAWLLVSQVVIVNEDAGATASLGRSHRLLKGVYWGAAGATLLLLVVITVLGMAVQAPVLAAVFADAMTTGESSGAVPLWALPFQVLGRVVSIFTTILLLVFAALLYYSRVETTEHAGLRARVDALDGPAPGPTGADPFAPAPEAP